MCASFSGEKPAKGPAATLLTTPQVDDMVSLGRPGLWPYINLSAKPSQLRTSTFYPPRCFATLLRGGGSAIGPMHLIWAGMSTERPEPRVPRFLLLCIAQSRFHRMAQEGIP